MTAINKEGGSLEVFPNLLGGQPLEENIHNLWTVTQKFTLGILESFDIIPKNMKKLFGVLGEIMIKKYGTLPIAPAGSLFFLRYICPAIVFSHGIRNYNRTVGPHCI